MRRLLIPLSALAILAPTSTVLAQDTIVEPSSEDVQRAAAFRESFFLRDDSDFVAESFRTLML